MVHPRPLVVQVVLLEAENSQRLQMFARRLKNMEHHDWAAEAKDCRNKRQSKTPKSRERRNAGTASFFRNVRLFHRVGQSGMRQRDVVLSRIRFSVHRITLDCEKRNIVVLRCGANMAFHRSFDVT